MWLNGRRKEEVSLWDLLQDDDPTAFLRSQYASRRYRNNVRYLADYRPFADSLRSGAAPIPKGEPWITPRADNSIIKQSASAAFNFAIGAGIGFAVKAVMLSTPFGIAAGATAAFAKASYTVYRECETDRGDSSRLDWCRANWKKITTKLLVTTALTGVGAIFGAEILPALFENINMPDLFSAKPDLPPAPLPVADVQANIPEAIANGSMEPQIGNIVPDDFVVPEFPDPVQDIVTPEMPPLEIPAEWKEIEALAAEGNSQAQKDLAMAKFNGLHGFAIDEKGAMELYRASAEAGNAQALKDIAHIAKIKPDLVVDMPSILAAARVLPDVEIDRFASAPSLKPVSLPDPIADVKVGGILCNEWTFDEKGMPTGAVCPILPEVLQNGDTVIIPYAIVAPNSL